MVLVIFCLLAFFQPISFLVVMEISQVTSILKVLVEGRAMSCNMMLVAPCDQGAYLTALRVAKQANLGVAVLSYL